ncbi:MAG: glycosyltransferase [Spirosomataceae bacterium]
MKKTILFIITKSETGGAQKFVSEQIRCLNNRKNWNLLLATNSEGWLTESVNNIIPKESIFLNPKIETLISISYLFNLILFILKEKPNLLVANSANGGIYGRLAGFFTGTKVIYVSHGWSSIYKGGKFQFIFNFIEKMFSYITSSILCISEQDRIKAVEILKISPSKIYVIHNSILPIKNKNQKLSGDILTVCRLASPKRVDILIEAMALIPEYKLHIIGDGPLLFSLKALVNKKKLGNITFCGYKSNFIDFNQYKLFCLISDSEGMPMSAIEAMSCGLPVILSNVGGCSEIINNNGFLVDNNPEHISHSIKKAFINYELFSDNSKNIFKSKFNLENNIYLFESFYQKYI